MSVSGPVNKVTVVQPNDFIGARRSSGQVRKMREKTRQSMRM